LLAVMLHDAGFPPARGADDPATRVVFIHSAPSAAPVITPAHPRTKPAQHARRNTARVPVYAASNETQPPAVTAKASHPGALDLSLAPLSVESAPGLTAMTASPCVLRTASAQHGC
jgi:hypothetical protein